MPRDLEAYPPCPNSEGKPGEHEDFARLPTVAERRYFSGIWTFSGAATTMMDGSVSEVFAFLADPANQAWLPLATSLKRLPEGPVGVGTIFAVPSRLGRELLASQEVTNYQLDQLIERSIPPGTRTGKTPARSFHRRYLVREGEGGTQVDLTVTIEIKSFLLKCLVSLFVPLFLVLPYAAIAFLVTLLFHFGEPPAEFDLAKANLGNWKSRYVLRWVAEDELARWKRAFESTKHAGSI